MKLFDSSQSYLGVDFDPESVKVVELQNVSGRPKLITYGYIDRELKTGDKEDSYSEAQEIGALIKAVSKKAKTTTSNAISALPAFAVFSSIITLPQMQKKDLDSAIRWEAKKVVPIPIDEMILDWRVIEGKKDVASQGSRPKASVIEGSGKEKKLIKITKTRSGENQRILLTAAPRNLVKKHMDVFGFSGLNLMSLDTESFALIRSLVGNDKMTLMIVDVGSIVTNVIIVSKGVPVLNRSIDIGGLTITKAIANSLNISLSRAEQFKYDIGLTSGQSAENSIPNIISETINPIITEITYSLNLFSNRDQGAKVEKIILTGGSSLLINLPEYLSEKLNKKVFIGDPWARVVYPEELRTVLDEIGPRYTTAIGLAMRNIT